MVACTLPYRTLEQIVVVPYTTLTRVESPGPNPPVPATVDCLQAPATLFPVPAETHKLRISEVRLRLVIRNEGPVDLSAVLLVAPGGQDPYSTASPGRIVTPLLPLGRRGGSAEHTLSVTSPLLDADAWNLGVQVVPTDFNVSASWRTNDYLEVRYQVLAQAKIP